MSTFELVAERVPARNERRVTVPLKIRRGTETYDPFSESTVAYLVRRWERVAVMGLPGESNSPNADASLAPGRDASVQTPSGVPVYLILQLGAVFLAVICVAALVGWIATSVPLVNPFAATLGIIASPFFFWMGRIARKKHERN